jgi:CelD/BcsL family acetyltransferase involved in cellulose biosynthesis
MPVQVSPQTATALRAVGDDPELVLAWEELADRLQASPFRYPGFVRAWHAAFGTDSGELLLATVWRDRQLAAALPLLRDGDRLATPANWHTPHVGLLAEDDDAATALARSLCATGARRLALRFLGASDCDTIAGAARDAGYRTHGRTLLRSPYVDLSAGWAGFEQALGASANKAMRRRRRRLAELGEVTLEAADGSAQLDDRYGELVRLEGLGWKGEQGTAIGSRPETLRFYRDVAEWAAQRGWLRIHLLRLDGTPIAAAYGLRAHGVHASMKIGHDPAHQKLAPGVMLMHDVIREACDEGLRTVELLGDEDPLKRSWTSLSREWRSLDAFAPTAGGRAEWAGFTVRRALRGARGRSARRLRDLRKREAQPGG